MKSSVEALEGNQIKLYVEVEETEFDADIDRAFKLIAKEVRLRGFRPGKAPRRVLEAQVGIGPAREQALRDGACAAADFQNARVRLPCRRRGNSAVQARDRAETEPAHAGVVAVRRGLEQAHENDGAHGASSLAVAAASVSASASRPANALGST